jgi:hypothetical protein
MNDASPVTDEALLNGLQQAAFGYFLETVNPLNGLVADTSREGSPCSIAVVGLALSCYPVAVERGWMTREDALERSLKALRFFRDSDQSGTAEATGYKGFYFHFLDMKTGARVWRSELSMIDTALLISGALTAAMYFQADVAGEAELRDIVDMLYLRIEWNWAQNGGSTIMQGWKPESGFLHYGWEGYSEAIVLYVLAMGSPTFPLKDYCYKSWNSTYQWENLYGYDFLYAGPLFIHQFSHAWIDFRDIRDDFMREKCSTYFENSRRATFVQREYAQRNPREFIGYDKNCWGLSAGDGPSDEIAGVDHEQRRQFGYAARGVPYGPDDGTIAGAAAIGSLPFAPDIVLFAVRSMIKRYPEAFVNNRFSSGFNATFPDADGRAWVSAGHFGLDQGIAVMMIENHRSELVWSLMRRCSYICDGLRRARFTGGWL